MTDIKKFIYQMYADLVITEDEAKFTNHKYLTLEELFEKGNRVSIVIGLYERLYKVCNKYKETSIGLSDDSEFNNILKKLNEFYPLPEDE